MELVNNNNNNNVETNLIAEIINLDGIISAVTYKIIKYTAVLMKGITLVFKQINIWFYVSLVQLLQCKY